MLNFGLLKRGGSGLPRSGLITYLKGYSDGLSFKQHGRTSNADAVRGTVLRGDGAGSGAADILTTDTITAGSPDVPTCTVNGTVTFANATDYWDVKVYRADVLIADWPMISLSTTEFDWSGNDNDLVLSGFTGDPIVETTDGTGSDRCNTDGYSARENLLRDSEELNPAGVGWSMHDVTLTDLGSGEWQMDMDDVYAARVYNANVHLSMTSDNRTFAVDMKGDGYITIEVGVTAERVLLTEDYTTYSVTGGDATSNIIRIIRRSAFDTHQVFFRNMRLSDGDTYTDYVRVYEDDTITGRQPAAFQGITDYPGPLSRSAILATKACITGDGSGSATISGLLTTDTITALSTAVPTCTTNGTMDFASGEDYSGITVTRSGSTWAYYPCENGHPTKHPGTTWLQDVVGGNHGTLTGFSGDPFGTCEVTEDNPSYFAQHGGSADYDGNDGLTLATNGILSDDTAADYRPGQPAMLTAYPGTMYFRDPLVGQIAEFADEVEFDFNDLDPADIDGLYYLGEKGFAVYSADASAVENKIYRTLDVDRWYGVEWDATESDPDVTRIGGASLHRTLPVHNGMYACLLNDDGTENCKLNPTDWDYDTAGNAVSRDGSQGQVMIYMPGYWFKAESDGDKRRWMLSAEELDGFTWNRPQYISAYEAALDRVNSKLSSVVNSAADYRGGDNNASWDAESRTLLGRPATAISRIDFRTYARNRGSGWEMGNYLAQRTLLRFFVTEFSTRNSQKAVNTDLDADGFKQGGLGDGVSNLNSTDWSNFNSQLPFIPCGYSDSLGSATADMVFSMPAEYGTLDTKVNRYRGVELPFGHIWENLDGVLLKIYADTEATPISEAYISDDPADWSDTDTSGIQKIGEMPRETGYLVDLLPGELLPGDAIGGGTTTYWCDRFYTSLPATGSSLRTVLLGGTAYTGSAAGLGYSSSHNSPSAAGASIGSRLCYIP